MENIALILMLAVTVEALIEYGKSIGKAIADKQAKTAITQLCAVAVSIGLCGLAGADLYAAVGVEFSLPWVGRILTGIFASRGANFVSDLIGRLTQKNPL
mgnify:CR=1 FL=1